MNSLSQTIGFFSAYISKSAERKPLQHITNEQIPVPELTEENNSGNFEEEDFTDIDAHTIGYCKARNDDDTTTEEEIIINRDNISTCCIQIGDKDNPQDVVYYENICYISMIKRETQYPLCIVNELNICGNDRKILFDELTRIHYKCLMSTNTLYCAFGIIDRAINLIPINSSDFKVYGIAALFIASKVEDIMHTDIQTMLKIVDDSEITRERVINAEIEISANLKFDFAFPTPIFFLDYYLRLIHKTYEQMLIARYIMELCITSEEFVDTKPSVIAATAVSITLMITKGISWTDELEMYSKYSIDALSNHIKHARNIIALECTKKYYPLTTEEQVPKHMFVYYKYKSSPFQSVSKKIGLGP